MTVAGLGGKTLDLKLPVWTPGSYLVREFSRHIEGVIATDATDATNPADGAGHALPVEKLDKNSWRIKTGGAESVTVRYQVYCFEPSVRTSFVDEERIAINGGSVFLFADGRLHEAIALEVALPAGMSHISTGMIADAPGRYTLPDYDRLVDSPLLIGNPRVANFAVDGIPHEVALFGPGPVDLPKLAGDCEKIVLAAKGIFGSLPYPKYAFLIELAPGGGGGLEHLASAHMFIDSFGFTRRQGEYDNLSLISHEYFHLWNVKRLRPLALGPFNYERENYTRDLWLAEGVTDYYADLLLRRAGLATPEELLKDLGKTIKLYEDAPGRGVQSAGDSSFDTWIKFYRPDEDSPNTTLSYYVKGKLIGWLLDGELRRRTGGKASLDDLMRSLFTLTQTRSRGYTDAEVVAAVEKLAPGEWVAAFFRDFVNGTAPIDWALLFAGYGLKLNPKPVKPEGITHPVSSLGVRLGGEGGGVRIRTVLAGTPAEAAGLNPGDEILALDGWRVAADGDLGKRLEERIPGERVELTLSRRGRLLNKPVTLGVPPPDSYEIVPVETSDDAAKSRYHELFAAEWVGKPATVK